jgi:type II restriction/modification system DNA methylase subunit YeeA
MIGFDDGSEKYLELNGTRVNNINSNLTSETDLTQAKPLEENFSIAFQGPVKVDPFEITNSVAQGMLSKSSLDGRSNTEVVKPWMNATDITRRPRNMWIIDFDEMSLKDASLFEDPFEYVKRHVKPLRDTNNDRQRRTHWWRLGRSGSDLKQAKADKMRMLITPRVSRHRIFIWASNELVPDSAVVAFARHEDYFLGIIHSKPHELWARQLGTQLREAESGFRYTPQTTFETFPFPWPPGHEPQDDPRVQAIAQAAKELVEKRDAWLNPSGLSEKELAKRTLTNLYNQRPTWLDLAHKKLDAAVFAAYGWPFFDYNRYNAGASPPGGPPWGFRR